MLYRVFELATEDGHKRASVQGVKPSSNDQRNTGLEVRNLFPKILRALGFETRPKASRGPNAQRSTYKHVREPDLSPRWTTPVAEGLYCFHSFLLGLAGTRPVL